MVSCLVFKFGESVGWIDGDCPWQVGRGAIKLLVNKIPPPADGLRQSQSGCNDINPLPKAVSF